MQAWPTEGKKVSESKFALKPKGRTWPEEKAKNSDGRSIVACGVSGFPVPSKPFVLRLLLLVNVVVVEMGLREQEEEE